MTAVSVLSSFSPSVMPGPVMPMDLAMRFYISQSPPPLRGFLSSYEELQQANKRVKQSATRCHNKQVYKPLRPCLSSHQRAVDGGDSSVTWNNKAVKKKVVFADSKGMSLTAIHVFSKFEDDLYQSKRCLGLVEDLQFDMTDLEMATMDPKICTEHRLVLDFKQPSADYLDFRNRLIRNSVCLENCSLQKCSLTGTIKVRNMGFEKSVHLRATFDSWTSFTDVTCTFMNNVYGCQDTDIFSFMLALPSFIPPQNRIEFCICFTVQGQTFWDNNDGKNYVLKQVDWNGEDLKGVTSPAPAEQKRNPEQVNCGMKLLEMEFDQFGSPRLSNGLFPGWQSWGQINTTVPYW